MGHINSAPYFVLEFINSAPYEIIDSLLQYFAEKID